MEPCRKDQRGSGNPVGRPFGRADRCGGHGPCPAYLGRKRESLYQGPFWGTLGATRFVGHAEKGKRGSDPLDHLGGKDVSQPCDPLRYRPTRIRQGRPLCSSCGGGQRGPTPVGTIEYPVQMWLVPL